VVAYRHGADGGRANPSVVNANTALEHDVDHIVIAKLVLVHVDTAGLPGLGHLFLAEPLATKHDAIMRCRVQVQNGAQAVLNSHVSAAEIRVRIVVLAGKISSEVVAIMHHNVVSVEEGVEFVAADLVVSHIDTH